jgi:hypothetical protein
MEAPLEISETLIWELHFLALSLLLGLCMRAAYDVLIVFRRLVKHSLKWVGAEDFLCCVCGAFLVFSLFYSENEGAPRGFALLGVAAGMALYHFGPSRLVCWLLEHLLRLLLWPVFQMVNFLRKLSNDVEL